LNDRVNYQVEIFYMDFIEIRRCFVKIFGNRFFAIVFRAFSFGYPFQIIEVEAADIV